MTAVNGICVVSSTTNTNTVPVVEASSSTHLVPIPFSIILLGVSACILVSRFIHTETIFSISIFAMTGVLASLCNLFYMMRSSINPPGATVETYIFVLVIGVIFSYVNNVIYLFVTKHTLLQDDMFILWKRGNVHLVKEDKLEQPSHEQLEDHLNKEEENNEEIPSKLMTYECFWIVVNVIGTATSHNLYAIIFSKLFGLSVFKASVRSVKTFHVLNYLWVASLLAFLFCFVGGIIKAASIRAEDTNYLSSVYESTDLIFVNFVFLLMGFLLLKKKKEVWVKEDLFGNDD